MRAVAYLNVDIAVSGNNFTVDGSPIFKDLLTTVAKKLGVSWDGNIGLLGDGSDYMPFMQYVGISSVDLGMWDPNSGYQAVYHSNYDSFYWYTKFGDPDFSKHSTVAKYLGFFAMRLANSRLLPFDLPNYVTALKGWVAELQTLSSTISLKVLNDLIQKLGTAVTAFQQEVTSASNYDEPMTEELIRSINDRMMTFDRSFLSSDPRLTGRPSFKHVVFTPSKFDSYAGVAFPAIYQAMVANNTAEVAHVAGRIALIIEGAADCITQDSL